jgi:hypothetical protein
VTCVASAVYNLFYVSCNDYFYELIGWRKVIFFLSKFSLTGSGLLMIFQYKLCRYFYLSDTKYTCCSPIKVCTRFSLFLYVSLCVWYLILPGVLLSIPPFQAFQNVLLGLRTPPADII